MGLLATSTTHLAHEENLITLCASCHEMFDNPTPIISILPADDIIQQIYNHEISDYVSREEAALVGNHRSRTILDIAPSAMRAVGYILSDDVHDDFGERFHRLDPVRPLKANPVLLILRFAVGGIGPVVETPVTLSNGRTLVLGLPGNIRSLVASLFSAWSRPDPSIVHRHSTPPPFTVQLPAPGESMSDRYRPRDAVEPIGAVNQTSKGLDHEMTGDSMEEGAETEASPSLAMYGDGSCCDDTFVFGPCLSTDGIVEYFLTRCAQ
jgi:cytochrome c553